MNKVREIKIFKCESCGSTKVTQKNASYYCEYCNSDYVYTKPEGMTSLLRVSVGLLLLFTLYVGYKSMGVSEVLDKPKQVKKPSSLQSVGINNHTIIAIKDLIPSQLIPHLKQKREKAFSKWMSQSEYQSRFSNGYYTRSQTYTAYLELDKYGNRRVLELPLELKTRKQSFYYTVKSGRELKNFQKTHLHRSMNGKTLLSMSSYRMHGTTFYSGTWVSTWAKEDEVSKLLEYGISPPKLKYTESKHVTKGFLTGENTHITLRIKTADKRDADTNSLIFITLNDSNERHVLNIAQYDDRRRGMVDVYTVPSSYHLNEIKSITFSTSPKSKDAWLLDTFDIQIVDTNRKIVNYRSNIKQWFSSEIRDKKKLGAKRSYTFRLDRMKKI